MTRFNDITCTPTLVSCLTHSHTRTRLCFRGNRDLLRSPQTTQLSPLPIITMHRSAPSLAVEPPSRSARLAVDPSCYSPGNYSSSSSDNNSTTSSLDSIIVTHVKENERRYHGFRAGRYLLPNDKAEQGTLLPAPPRESVT
jgi:hypothetical protein